MKSFLKCASIFICSTLSLAQSHAQIVHIAPNGLKEMAEVLSPFPFLPPDIQADDGEYSSSEAWYRKNDAKKIHELAEIDFYIEQGPTSVGIAPKLHNSSAGFELYKLRNKLWKTSQKRSSNQTLPGWALEKTQEPILTIAMLKK